MKINSLAALLLSATVIIASSCQKEVDYVDLGGNNNPPGTGNPSNKSIIGNWKFVRMLFDMNINDKSDDGMLDIVTIMEGSFTSFNEKGTLKIEANKMTGNGIAYSVDTTFKASFYSNGSLDDEIEVPYVYDVPATNSSSQYQKINDDSIAVQGGILDIDMPSGTTPIQPSGMRISWSGDTLLLTTRINKTETTNAGGISSQTTYDLKQVVKLVRN
ncbi:MAG: hypothetical protein EOO01_22280 [Chitinophagaceae bacterium]|nr:MAG: hypothetical protein EOO01_22280 [Chitinophagaceae bacterium]